MIFRETWQKVLSGEKTQTRRLVKANDSLFAKTTETNATVGIRRNGRIKWQTGKAYAVQRGRGKPAIARILITDIYVQELSNITLEEANMEGYATIGDFMGVWEKIHPNFDASERVIVLEFEVFERYE